MKEGAGMADGMFGYQKSNKDQRKYFKGGKHMKKEVKRNIPGMSVHPVVDCKECNRRKSISVGEMRGGEKKRLNSVF